MVKAARKPAATRKRTRKMTLARRTRKLEAAKDELRGAFGGA